ASAPTPSAPRPAASWAEPARTCSWGSLGWRGGYKFGGGWRCCSWWSRGRPVGSKFGGGGPPGGGSKATGAATAARRPEQRNRVNTIGPSSTTAATLVIARPVSQPRVEVARVNSTNRCRFATTGAPATNDSSVPAPMANGQNHMFIRNPYA